MKAPVQVGVVLYKGIVHQIDLHWVDTVAKFAEVDDAGIPPHSTQQERPAFIHGHAFHVGRLIIRVPMINMLWTPPVLLVCPCLLPGLTGCDTSHSSESCAQVCNRLLEPFNLLK